MSLLERIRGDMTGAMREGKPLLRDTLRMTIAGMESRRIELGRDLEESEEIAVVQKAVKTRLDSASQFSEAGREELATKERTEAGFLDAYLPSLVGPEETREIVKGLISELGLSSKAEMGQLMKALMSRHKGQIDGRTAQQCAGEMLG